MADPNHDQTEGHPKTWKVYSKPHREIIWGLDDTLIQNTDKQTKNSVFNLISIVSSCFNVSI